ncbi:MAG: beta-ketoacyl-ACP synthase II [Deltaproteobacteria bacterium]|nr:beta-ketoacyl-ACP synthase II [Deltaproteobacteria bacterium]MBI3389052.1 beta-ketoacyl-ACP synthase II [Deltaproteobacteria bacterium]
MARTERRVVVTGLGLVTPLGNTLQSNLDALMTGRSGIGPITHFDASEFPSRIAGEVRDFDPGDFIEKKEIKKMDGFIHYAVAAAQMAVDDATFRVDAAEAERVGVLVGVGMGGIATVEEYVEAYLKHGLKRVSPFFIPRLIANLAPGNIAIRFGLKGMNYAPASACASGGHAIGEAFRLIRFGYQDAMLAGGSEAAVTPLGVGGFAVMRALSTRNEEPQRASRPFDRTRDGFVIAEGAGVLVLESLERAQQRGARIYAEIVGYGANADAYHITTPSPDGQGATRCMQLALEDGAIDPLAVDYINAHGTSTPYNDATETKAIKRVFGEHAARLAVSSTKSLTGHLLGAGGAVEAAYTALALHHQRIPPTWNYSERDPECDLDYVPNQPRDAALRVALSNSFGFGGANVCLALQRWTQ